MQGDGARRILKKGKSFNADNAAVVLVSLKAGGVGLNLTGADTGLAGMARDDLMELLNGDLQRIHLC